MDASQVQQALQQMQAQLQQQDHLNQQLQHQLQQQAQQLQQAAAAVAAPAAAPAAAAPQQHAHSRRAKIPAASNFHGTASLLDGWVREMRQQFDYYQYGEADSVAMAAAQLRGVALDWWSAQLSAAEQAPLRVSFAAFEQALRARFQPVNSAQTARLALDSLRQGAKQSAADYISAFRRLLVSVPDMSEADKVHRFVQGLRPREQQQLIVHGVNTLDAAISMAARVGSLGVYAAAAGYSHGSGNGNAMDVSALGLHAMESDPPDDGDDDAAAPVTRGELRELLNAMQQQRAGNRGGKRPPFGRDRRAGPPRVAGLSEQEVRRRLDERLCFTCGQADHRKSDCPQNQSQDFQTARRGK